MSFITSTSLWDVATIYYDVRLLVGLLVGLGYTYAPENPQKCLILSMLIMTQLAPRTLRDGSTWGGLGGVARIIVVMMSMVDVEAEI
jgi:hypothetical protein